jgi:biopolymer transport protein ExbB/TolQ
MAFRSSHRPTREWPLLLLAIAIVCAVCIPLWQWTSAGQSGAPGMARWTPERFGRLLLGPEQIACYCAFTWAGFILLGRYLEVRRQRRAFTLDLLPPEVCILPEDARLLQRRVEQQEARGGPYLLANMIRLALGKYAVSRSGHEVSDTVKAQADVDMSRMVSSMSMVHYLAWAIPAIGFLGTVRGLAGSLTLGGETKMAIADFIKQATGHLNVAFDCTLVALALSLVVMFLLHAVQREEESLVIDCQQYCLEHLVARLYNIEGEHAEPPAPSPYPDLGSPTRRLA